MLAYGTVDFEDNKRQRPPDHSLFDWRFLGGGLSELSPRLYFLMNKTLLLYLFKRKYINAFYFGYS